MFRRAEEKNASNLEQPNHVMSHRSIKSIRSLFLLNSGVLAFMLSAGLSTSQVNASDNRAPELSGSATAIAVPPGNKVHFHAYAIGVQIYTWNGTTWGASVPEAVLYDADGNVVGIHYAGPTWETESGSKVVGLRVAAASAFPPVDPNAIPWLLLQAASTEGPGVLQRTSYIQRVHTAGGKAPASPGTAVGEVARIPYTAEYFFYRNSN